MTLLLLLTSSQEFNSIIIIDTMGPWFFLFSSGTKKEPLCKRIPKMDKPLPCAEASNESKD